MEDDQLVGRQRQHRVCFSVIVRKLDFIPIRSQDFDDSANLAANESVSGPVMCECDNVQNFDRWAQHDA
jgi:hypothetical protein